MNKTFKVARSLTRGTVVTSEAASSYQGKALKTVIATAAALVAGSVMAAEFVDVPKAEEVKPVSTLQSADDLTKADKWVFEATEGATPVFAKSDLAAGKTLWINGTTENVRLSGLVADSADVSNFGTIYVTSNYDTKDGKALPWQHKAMFADGATATNKGVIVVKNGYGMTTAKNTKGSVVINEKEITVVDRGVGMEINAGAGKNVGTITVGKAVESEGKKNFTVGVQFSEAGGTFTNEGQILAADATAAIFAKAGTSTITLAEGSVTNGLIVVENGGEGKVASADIEAFGAVNGSLASYGTTNVTKGALDVESVTVGFQEARTVDGTPVSAQAGTVTVAADATLKAKTLAVVNGTFTATGDVTVGDVVLGSAAIKADTDKKIEAAAATNGDLIINKDFTAGTITLATASSGISVNGSLTADKIEFAKLPTSSGAAARNSDVTGVVVAEGKEMNVKSLVLNNASDKVSNAGTLTLGTVTVAKDLSFADGSITNTGTIVTDLSNLVSLTTGEDGKLKADANAFGTALLGQTNGKVSTTYNKQFTVEDYNTITGAIGNVDLHGATFVSVDEDGKAVQATWADAKKIGYVGDTDVVDGYGSTTPVVRVDAKKDVTIRSLTMKPNNEGQKPIESLGLNVEVDGKVIANVNKLTIRGDANGNLINGLDKTSKDFQVNINKVYFGEVASDHGKLDKAMTVKGASGVTAGTYAFTGKTTFDANFDVASGAIARFGETAGTGTIAAKGTVVLGHYLPVAEEGETDKTLQIGAATTVTEGGLVVFGSKHEAAATQFKAANKDANVIFIGEQTTLNASQTLGSAATDKNIVAIDLGSVVANGYTTAEEGKMGSVVKTTDKTISAAASGSMTVEILNLNSKALTIDEKGGIATLNLGTAFGTTKVDLGTPFYEVTNSNGTVSIEVLENEVNDLLVDSELHSAGIVANAVRSFETPSNAIASVVYKNWAAWDKAITEETVKQGIAAGYLDKDATVDNYNEKVLAGKEIAFENLKKSVDASVSNSIIKSEHAATNMAVLGGAFSTTLDVNDQVTAALNRRMTLANVNVAREVGATPWVDVFGTMNEGKRLFGNGAGYEADIYGAMLGVDYTAACGGVLGVALSVGTADANSVGNGQKVDNDQDFWGISAYASKQFGQFNTKIDLGYLNTSNDMSTSSAWFGATSESLDADVFTVGLGAEFLASAGSVNVVPHVGIRMTQLDMDDSKFGAEYDSMTVYQMPVGVSFSGTFETNGWKVAPQFDIAVVPTFGDKDAVASYGYGITDTTRVVDTNPVQATLGVAAQNGAWTFGLNYGLTAGGDDRMNNAFNANVRYTF